MTLPENDKVPVVDVDEDTDKERNLNPRIYQFPPFIGVELGFTLATADEKEQSRTKDEADHAASDLLKKMKRFPEDSPESHYLCTVRMAAVGLSRGLSRRFETLKTVVTKTEADYEKQMQEFVNSPLKGSLLTVGWKIMALCGFTTFLYALACYIFALPAMQHEANHANGGAQWASLAFAVGIALCTAYLKVWTSGRTVKSLTKERDKTLWEAREKFLAAAEEQYTMCADSCNAAWLALTGKEPIVSTKAFDRLLSGALARCQADITNLILSPPVTDERTFSQKYLFWIPFVGKGKKDKDDKTKDKKALIAAVS